MVVTVVAVVTPVAVVHEDMHQRTRQQQEERQCAEKVGTVLGQQEVRSDGTHDEQADGVARPPKRRGPGVVLGEIMIHSWLRR